MVHNARLSLSTSIRALVLACALAGCTAQRPAGDRSGRDPIAAIAEWNASLSPGDRAAKYCKMAASALAFYRGTNHLFWSDFAGDERLVRFGSDRTRVWIQGDLHAFNIGAFDNDRGDVEYNLNDFDDAVIADYQYDVWRMAASIVLLARANGVDADADVAAVLEVFTNSYLDAIAAYSDSDDEREAFVTRATATGRLAEFLANVARDNSRARALEEWTRLAGGVRTLDVSLADLEALPPREAQALRDAVATYGATLSGRLDYTPAYFRVLDVARRLGAGIGSLGAPRYYVLIEGPSESPDDDRILDVKRQSAPTAYHFLSAAERAGYDAAFPDHARRHARAMKALLDHVDDHLGWLSLDGAGCSVRERSVYKQSFPLAELDSPAALEELARTWGVIIATAHSRADEDFDDRLVPHSVDGEIDSIADHRRGEFHALVRAIAFEHADRVLADWRAFVRSVAGSCEP